MPKDSMLLREKRKALYLLYKQGLEDGRFSSIREAGNWLATQPAPSFFISSEQASDFVGKILSHQSLMDVGAAKRRKIWRLFHDYEQYLAEHPGTKKSRDSIMEELVERPAPEFYMTGEAVRKLLRIEIAEIRRKTGWGE